MQTQTTFVFTWHTSPHLHPLPPSFTSSSFFCISPPLTFPQFWHWLSEIKSVWLAPVSCPCGGYTIFFPLPLSPFFFFQKQGKVKLNVRGQNVCTALIPMSLPAGKEKHHDSRSQRLKHQLATVNEASLASSKFLLSLFLPLSLFHFLPSHFSLSLITAQTTTPATSLNSEIRRGEWQWLTFSRKSLLTWRIV